MGILQHASISIFSLYLQMFFMHRALLGEVQTYIWRWGFIVWSECVLIWLRNTPGQPSETSDDHPWGSLIISFDISKIHNE
jgi:hypothetical protein